MPRLATVYEPGDSVITVDDRGQAREWVVRPDGLLQILPGIIVHHRDTFDPDDEPYDGTEAELDNDHD